MPVLRLGHPVRAVNGATNAPIGGRTVERQIRLPVANQTNAWLENLVAYLRDAGFEASGAWQPDFNREFLYVYAEQISADIIAVMHRNSILASLFGGNYVNELRDRGYRVEELHEAKM